ncbi:MAG: hypothetical protein UR70_C0001G0037 [Candidatus Nomurabacteria bacterium GW2011_GWB1_35_20]|uniref:Uncharacterized protein n=1 Tax=Candidatus Nomurabacteria bacterium GW2011_GWB1_35_20 TaxID=1618740 RepID=A0A0G0BUC4_9BACT|nr:MAG: hypothetical protein UR70_C0001G0037 [Candidatus Nomurabacteria bacterium GW2011_GWB1_35_20]
MVQEGADEVRVPDITGCVSTVTAAEFEVLPPTPLQVRV